MISFEQALEKILSHIDVLKEERRPILDCLGQVLAEDVCSGINVPPWDNSAMDSYAVQSKDTYNASPNSPRFLSVVGTVAAGYVSQHEVKPGTAIRIMTGAPIPKGADSVVSFEDTNEALRKGPSSEVGILHKVKSGSNIRQAGEYIAAGSTVLRQGTPIGPLEVGILASLGRTTVAVIRRPVVAILATGDELEDINQPLSAGKVYNSSTYSLAAMVRHCGGVPNILGVASDREDLLIGRIHQGLNADMLVTTGGTSAGDYDLIKDVLAKEGEIIFETVRIRPGKSLAFGKIKGFGNGGIARNMPLLALPGNPVGSMVAFELFARPAILKMMGKINLDRPSIEAVLEDSIVNSDGFRIFALARVEKRGGQYSVRLNGRRGAGVLTSITSANGLVTVPEDKAKVEKGDKVQVLMLDWNESTEAI